MSNVADHTSTATAAGPADAGGLTVPLSRAVQAFGDPIKEITLREPNGGDVQACGFPLIITSDETVRFDADAMTQLISRLGNVPMKTAQALSIRDWQTCAMAIAGFFGEAD